MGQLRPTDIASIVFSVLCAILGICMLGLAGGYLKWVNIGLGWNVVSFINFGMGSWVLLCAAIGIAAGATMHQGVYACSIVMYVIGIIGLFASGIATILGVFLGLFGLGINSFYDNSYNTTMSRLNNATYNELESAAQSMPTGLIIVNFTAFILMIVASCVVCCGTCCGGSTNRNGQGGPPVYAQQAASGQGYGNNGPEGMTMISSPPVYAQQPVKEQGFADNGSEVPLTVPPYTPV